MIVFPICKINLGLRVFDKRADGFHNIETIFYPVQWCDALEALPVSTPADHHHLSFETRGLKIEGSEKDNLCVKAVRLLQQKFKVPSIKMCLLKNIPLSGGLGGGSSDGALTLKLVNDLFHLKVSIEQLRQFASQLGSDCAFFIENIPCLATGKGDNLIPIALDLSSYYILIVHPALSVSTAWAYDSAGSGPRSLSEAKDKKGLEEIIRQPVKSWRKELKNDFEEVVFKKYPEIAKIKKQLYKQGALYASMSGSGSAVYGIFSEEPPAVSFPGSYKIFRSKLSPTVSRQSEVASP
jgi:4-diphosphocytidyl-2-C-methyl-D-erythritol kinase